MLLPLLAVGLLALRQFTPLHEIKLHDLSVVDFPLYLMLLLVLTVSIIFVSDSINARKWMEMRFPVLSGFLWGAELHDHPRRIEVHKWVSQSVWWGTDLALIGAMLLAVVGWVWSSLWTKPNQAPTTGTPPAVKSEGGTSPSVSPAPSPATAP